MTSNVQTSNVYVWDATLSCERTSKEEIIERCKLLCKKWCFQQEKGEETGFLHYQCRFNLKEKKRLTQMKKLFGEGHYTPTRTENANKEMFYVSKEETRVAGPWRDETEIEYIPRQIRGITLRPWQQQIVDDADVWDTRSINVVYDPTGNNGKSILCQYVDVYNVGNMIPPINDYKDLMRLVMDMPKRKLYCIDMPRAMKKDKIGQIYSAIETIKSGYAYDDRYHFRKQHFDCPNIWVFTNNLPDREYLSEDRWVLWKIVDGELRLI